MSVKKGSLRHRPSHAKNGGFESQKCLPAVGVGLRLRLVFGVLSLWVTEVRTLEATGLLLCMMNVSEVQERSPLDSRSLMSCVSNPKLTSDRLQFFVLWLVGWRYLAVCDPSGQLFAFFVSCQRRNTSGSSLPRGLRLRQQLTVFTVRRSPPECYARGFRIPRKCESIRWTEEVLDEGVSPLHSCLTSTR